MIRIPFATFQPIEFWAFQVAAIETVVNVERGTIDEHITLNFAAMGVPERLFRGDANYSTAHSDSVRHRTVPPPGGQLDNNLAGDGHGSGR